MLQTKARVKVLKADGSSEDYLHTKVLATFNNCLAALGQSDIKVAEEFADVITYHLYKQKVHSVASGEIFTMIKGVLCSTGFEEAAEILSTHQSSRSLMRGRIEVLSVDVRNLSSAEDAYKNDGQNSPGRWNKSRIVSDLVTKYKLERQLARTIAGAVEEKILNLRLRRLSTELIKQIVLGETAAMLHAHRQLQNV
jgi:hypothetical protein